MPALLLACLPASWLNAQQAATEGADKQAGLSALVARLRQEQKLIGLGAVVMVDGRVTDRAVDGQRAKGKGVPLQLGDRWHLGSITKSITATMLGRLVESGKLSWDATVGECYAGEPVDEAWAGVTLRQLLTHTSGAKANFSIALTFKRPAEGPDRVAARRAAVLAVIGKPPQSPPGEGFRYSNVGYTIAGAMAEQATGQSWEELVREQVFAPLQMSSADFGPPKSTAPGYEQPRGHAARFGFKLVVNDTDDNTPIMGPAGTACMTLEDLCVFANEHLQGGQGGGVLLQRDTYQQLHRVEQNNYACGWVSREEGGGASYWHNGSNTMWYAFVTWVPDLKLVVAVAANDGDVAAGEAAAAQVVEAAKQTLAPAAQE